MNKPKISDSGFCERDDIDKILQGLKSIFLNDKTQYNYSGKDSLNKFGGVPQKGKRWNTPAEIAMDIIRELKVAGYKDPFDEGR